MRAFSGEPSGLPRRDQAALQAEGPRAGRLAPEPPGERHRDAAPEDGEPRQGADHAGNRLGARGWRLEGCDTRLVREEMVSSPSMSKSRPVTRGFQPRMDANSHRRHVLRFVFDHGSRESRGSPPTGLSRFVRARMRTGEPRARATHPRHPCYPRFPTFVPFVSFVVQFPPRNFPPRSSRRH